MSTFTQVLNENNQFIIAVKVIPPCEPEEYQDGTAQQLIIAAPPRRALIDTGASNTCISQECADELDLVPIAQALITTASGICEVNRYEIDFAIPVATTEAMPVETEDGERTFQVVVTGEDHWAHIRHKINSVPPIEGDRGFDFILGMDILSKMHITMFGNRIIMSF